MNKIQIKQKLSSEIVKVLNDTILLRHHIHAEPEIADHEFSTREKILSFLEGLPLSIHPPYLGTDIVADLKGTSEEFIVLRADIDALPLREETGLPYASKVNHMMHACGHDGHAAILAGTARVLSALQKELPVSVRFVFQPGEERVASGKKLVQKGALGAARAAYALHGLPGLPSGMIQCRRGVYYAAGSTFCITITGKGCHGSKPEEGVNPIPFAADLVNKLFSIHCTENKKDGSVVTVCVCSAGTLSNIIPDTARIEGTVRYLEEKRGYILEKIIREAAVQAIRGTGVETEIQYWSDYDIPVINTDEGYERTRNAVETFLPDNSYSDAPRPSMGNEDFAFYLQGRQGAMIGLGQGTDSPVLHNCKYNFNDRTIETGIRYFCGIVFGYIE